MTHANLTRLNRYEERLREYGFYLRAARVREWIRINLEEA